jgi:hypothetical protein
MKKRLIPCSLQTLLILSFLVTPMSFASAATLPSINSTSQNRPDLPVTPVPKSPLVNLKIFRIIATNDLGMHCGDLDYRVAAILPPFNVVHSQVILISPGPRILNGTEANVYFSAASNPKDPALQRPMDAPIYKTNFWDQNPRTGNTLAFDAYDSFYPAGILRLFPLTFDIGLPVPDLERLYLGDKTLVADQQAMPSVKRIQPPTSNPYVDNRLQKFQRFINNYPFFISFPFGFTLPDRNWFAAEGIPIAPFDDFGRKNPYPLLRIQAKDKTGKLTGIKGQILASIDTVTPVSAEADCFRCHTSSVDGGNGQAACLPGLDGNCPKEGSPTNRSGVAFAVTQVTQDKADVPPAVSREWAADWNILRLHDAKHSTTLADATPVACQRCHYSPALDLAQLGPVGPGTGANGKEQTIHRTNSRVMHEFHGNLDLFDYSMPKPNSPTRTNPKTGKPVINVSVTNVLNQTCYQCHPGRDTNCLRGAMFNGGLVCQDCHGNMKQVGDDFSSNFPVIPFPDGVDLKKRIPWASEPGCQSCHTGDALTTIAKSDPYVIPSTDGIRLLQAYRTSDASATPISAPTSRFAENLVDGKRVLYRLSKDNHAGIFCEGCHGSTHAEWPVKPSSGTLIANDNQPAIQAQGHAGKIIECTACHQVGTLPVNLNGPHGMHAVNDSRWVNGHEDFLDKQPLTSCQTCHGKKGEGTVLGKAAAARSFSVEGKTVTIANGQLVKCNLCHSNPIK